MNCLISRNQAQRFWVLVILAVMVGTIHTARAEVGVFNQCHNLCSNEQGRTELRLMPGNEIPSNFRWAFRFETAFLTVPGRYTLGSYNPREPNSSAVALEFLPTLMFRPNPDIQLNLMFPLELNHSYGVVIPSLHPVPGDHSEFAPGGILASIHFRIPFPRSPEFDSWAGIGYKLSKASGTDDVTDDLPLYPEAGLDGLGSGSDDIYLIARTVYSPLASDWRLGGGLELRFHMLPRFQRFFGTTLDYQMWSERKFGPSWGLGLRLTGFYTGLRTLGISEKSLLIASPQAFYWVSESLRLTGSIFSEVPIAALNNNVLQAVGVSVSLAYAW